MDKVWLDSSFTKEQRVLALTLYIGRKLSGTHANLAEATIRNVTDDQLIAIMNDFDRIAEANETNSWPAVQTVLQEFVDQLEAEARERIVKALAEI